MTGFDLAARPIHLGKCATAMVEPEFPRDERAMQWYVEYAARHAQDGEEGRLISCFEFTADWPGWEMHPAGDEVVICLAGGITLIQELGGEHVRTPLGPGQYAINPSGVWHTADIAGPSTGLFVTTGLGTQHRPR